MHTFQVAVNSDTEIQCFLQVGAISPLKMKMIIRGPHDPTLQKIRSNFIVGGCCF